MSDGYVAIIGLILEIVRFLKIFFKEELLQQIEHTKDVVFKSPGIVLIDELDVHLHPKWQVLIGEWLIRHFPLIQFVVTTHSPLVCRSAKNGSVWKLEREPAESRRIDGVELDRLIYGNILEAMGTNLFGTKITQSPEAITKLERLASLSRREISKGLTQEEASELQELKRIFIAHDPLDE
jgi:predicted ATP-binding protein involved in virulence